tara:strand:+ start:237 stop:734 length:498 start_codon:yes stop_codon:yes gene_type:complete
MKKMNFSIEIGYVDVKHEEFESIDEIDADDLYSYCTDIDDFRIYDTKLIIVLNGKEHIFEAKEYDDDNKSEIRPKEGKIIVVTDERGYKFNDYPNDYGEEAAWFCETLKIDLDANSVDLKQFKYKKDYDSTWEYKGEEIIAYITCDMSSTENVSVLIDGDEIMST